MPKKRRIVVIARRREFDESMWKRLLIAYAYALHDKRQRESAPAPTSDSESAA